MPESRKRPAETEEHGGPSSSKVPHPSEGTENRDFLAEFEQVRSDADKVKNLLISKLDLGYSSMVNSGTLERITTELKAIRNEIKENQERIDKKFDDLQCEVRGKMDNLTKEMDLIRGEIIKLNSIRQAILGNWQIISHENFEGYQMAYKHSSLESFSENLKFRLVDGKLLQQGAGYEDVVEGDENGAMLLYVEGDHLKSRWSRRDKIDYYMVHGNLHVDHHFQGNAWKRVYKKSY